MSPRLRPLRVSFTEEMCVKKILLTYKDMKLTNTSLLEFLLKSLSWDRTPMQFLQYKNAKQLMTERMNEKRREKYTCKILPRGTLNSFCVEPANKLTDCISDGLLVSDVGVGTCVCDVSGVASSVPPLNKLLDTHITHSSPTVRSFDISTYYQSVKGLRSKLSFFIHLHYPFLI